ncbi:MAG: flippase [bacterium]
MNSRNLAKNTTFYTMALAGQKALSFVYFILVARFIGVEDQGKFTFALSFTTIFAMFLDLGLTQIIIRETAKDKNKAEKYLAATVGFKIAASFFIYALVIVLVNIMGYSELTKNLVYVSGLVMLLDSFSLSFYGAIRGHQNLFYESIGVILNQIIVLAIGVVVIFMHLGLIPLMAVYLLGSLSNFIWSVFNLQKKFGVRVHALFDWPLTRQLLLLSLPFAIAGIFSRIFSSIDVVLLSKMAGDRAVGIYSVAFRAAFALQFVAMAFSAAIYPAFSNYFAHEREKLSDLFVKSMYWLMFLAAPLSFGVISIADKAIVPIFGAQYADSVLPLQILMAALLLVFLCFPIGALLNACDRQRRHTINLGIVATFSFLANLFLIPIFSYVGSAYANFFSYLLLFILGIIVAGQIINYNKKFLFISMAKIFLACIIMWGAVDLIKDKVHFITAVVLGVLVYFLVAYALGLYSITSIKGFAKEFLNKKSNLEKYEENIAGD